MRFNPRATIDQSQIEQRTGGGGGGLGGGKLTVGGVVILGLVFLVQQVTGVDVSGLVPGNDGSDGSDTTAQSTCFNGDDANKSDQCAVGLLATSIQAYWAKTFTEQVDGEYEKATAITFENSTQSGCGPATAATGPFYCPRDRKVYVETNFMKDMLEGQLGAKGGPFALAYVVAHEYGHHVENLIGRLPGDNRTGRDSDSVKTELMADCLGGMWAKSAQESVDAKGEKIILDLTQDDIASAIDAATAVGDDRIQEASGGSVNPDAWTHGSSAQRVKWFNIGLTKGSLQDCDTFAADSL